MIRLAANSDIVAITQIYDEIHTQEEKGITTTRWVRYVYPTRKTAEDAISLQEMYVLEDGGEIVAAAKINQEQMPQYSVADWTIPAKPEDVLVLHTLVVSPRVAKKGYGKAFIAFYNSLAKQRGCTVLRIDTNERNQVARKLYASVGFKEIGIVPCTFNGIEGVGLVCMEREVL